MTKKCKHCFSILGEQDSVCSVCKIDSTKDKATMTKEEKRVVYYCRTLSIIGFLVIVGGVLGIIAGLTGLFGLQAEGKMLWYVLNLIFAVAFIIFGLSLRKYKSWCYVGGIILFAIAIIMGFIEGKAPSILFGILFLFYIALPTSKKILYRQL